MYYQGGELRLKHQGGTTKVRAIYFPFTRRYGKVFYLFEARCLSARFGKLVAIVLEELHAPNARPNQNPKAVLFVYFLTKKQENKNIRKELSDE